MEFKIYNIFWEAVHPLSIIPRCSVTGENRVKKDMVLLKNLNENFEYVAEPCRNFCIFAHEIFIDPVDNREKIALSNFTDGGTGSIIIIDPENGEHETIGLPGDEGAWALLNYKNEKLIVGTCSKFGYVHVLNLKTREWMPSLRCGNEQYIWNLTIGSDGMVYGGTWPGCALLKYDPDKHTLTNTGKPSDVPGNLYLRLVKGDIPGYLIISCGHVVNQVFLMDIATGKKRLLGKPGRLLKEITPKYICLDTGSGVEYYSRDTFELVENPVPDSKKHFEKWADSCVGYIGKLKSGKVAGYRGQEYFIADNEDTVPEFIRIPGEAPATTIMTLTARKDGSLWGSTALGQTIFRYDTATGEYWNSPQVCSNGGEVYGMRFINDMLYLATYAGGDHVVYNPELPWDQFNNINPKTLETVGPDLVRPIGKSVVGPDGNFWTGWAAKYGTYGGGLTRIDANSHKMTRWYDPVPGQAIAGLTSDSKYLYFTTNGEANGRDSKIDKFSLCVWDAKGEIVWKHLFMLGAVPGVVLYSNERLYVSVSNNILVYKTGVMELLFKVPTNAHCTSLLELSDGNVAAFCDTTLIVIDPKTERSEEVSKLPGMVGISGLGEAVIAADGNIYFSSWYKLYRFNGSDTAALKSR